MKSIFVSKTIIVSVIEIIIGILLYLKSQVDAGYILTGAGIIQAVLRVITKEGVNLFGDMEEDKK